MQEELSIEEQARRPARKELIGGPRQPVVDNLTEGITEKADPICPQNGTPEQTGRYETPEPPREGCSSDVAGVSRPRNPEESAGKRKITEHAAGEDELARRWSRRKLDHRSQGERGTDMLPRDLSTRGLAVYWMRVKVMPVARVSLDAGIVRSYFDGG